MILALYPSQLRPKCVEQDIDTSFKNGLQLPQDEALEALQRNENEPDMEYIQRATNIMHQSIVHYWPSKKDRFQARVPLTENYILWILSFLPTGEWEYFSKYVFWNYKKAIRRGFGLCRQQAQAMKNLLDKQGFDVDYLALNGHVVVQTEINGSKHILDPDFNVIIPHSIDEVKHDPSLVCEYYSSGATPQTSDLEPLDITNAYQPPYDLFDPFKQILLEKIAYILLYLFPVGLICIGIYSYLRPL